MSPPGASRRARRRRRPRGPSARGSRRPRPRRSSGARAHRRRPGRASNHGTDQGWSRSGSMRRTRFTTQAGRVAAALCLLGGAAGATTGSRARHDGQRTGRSTGATRLVAPAIRWRHYLGGAVRASQMVTTDVDRDGVTDVVYVAAGKVICKHADDTLVWESPLVDVRALAGVADLDGDGRPEVVAVGTTAASSASSRARTAGSSGRSPPPCAGSAGRRASSTSTATASRTCTSASASTTPSPPRRTPSAARAPPRGSSGASPPLPDNGCGTDADVAGDLDGDGAPRWSSPRATTACTCSTGHRASSATSSARPRRAPSAATPR
jgi:hypothetical protein